MAFLHRFSGGRLPMISFMFATGIENSVPKIQNGRHRVDEMEKCGFCASLARCAPMIVQYRPRLHWNCNRGVPRISAGWEWTCYPLET